MPTAHLKKTHANNVPSTFTCRLQWKARRAEIEVLAKQAVDLSNDAKRMPVLADITLLRTLGNGSAARPGQSPPPWTYLLCFTQLWMSKCGQPFPSFANKVLECIGTNIHHPHQMSLAQHSAYHLREIIFNLDMLAIARSTKLTAASKEKVEDETMEHVNAPASWGGTEFYGGEHAEEAEDDEAGAETWHPVFSFSRDRLSAILSRSSEVAAASRKGRKSAAVMQMKTFDDYFHTLLNTPVRPSTVQAQKAHLSYAQPHLIDFALLHQDAILKEMRTVHMGGETDVNPETDIGGAVLHNLQPKNRSAEWIDLDNALKGPAHVAKLLIKQLQDSRSKPGKPYKVNAEQLECTALFVAALDKGFAKRPDASNLGCIRLKCL